MPLPIRLGSCQTGQAQGKQPAKERKERQTIFRLAEKKNAKNESVGPLKTGRCDPDIVFESPPKKTNSRPTDQTQSNQSGKTNPAETKERKTKKNRIKFNENK